MDKLIKELEHEATRAHDGCIGTPGSGAHKAFKKAADLLRFEQKRLREWVDKNKVEFMSPSYVGKIPMVGAKEILEQIGGDDD